LTSGVVSGGCRCGAIRARAYGVLACVISCHLLDYQRSSGAFVSLFVGYRRGQLERVGRTQKSPFVEC
jgi:hypothetical protein